LFALGLAKFLLVPQFGDRREDPQPLLAQVKSTHQTGIANPLAGIAAEDILAPAVMVGGYKEPCSQMTAAGACLAGELGIPLHPQDPFLTFGEEPHDVIGAIATIPGRCSLRSDRFRKFPTPQGLRCVPGVFAAFPMDMYSSMSTVCHQKAEGNGVAQICVVTFP